MNQILAIKDGLLAEQRARTAAARAKARHAASRQITRERGAIAIPVPRNATPRQAASIRAVAAEIVARERSSKIQRQWERLPLHTAPPGTAPVAVLLGLRIVRLCVDACGVLRLIGTSEAPGPAVSVSEACALAARG
jgi:hypothetical protein